MSKIDKKNRFYYDSNFLGSIEGRSLRILSEYYGPLQKLERNNVSETIVFFGSARIPSKKEAKDALENHSDESDFQTIAKLKMDLKMSRYYEEARSLANKFTSWSKNLKDNKHRTLFALEEVQALWKLLIVVLQRRMELMLALPFHCLLRHQKMNGYQMI